jgi:hypothetical protein
MALLCDALHESTEREEFALEMCNCNNWDDCLTLAKEWELQHEDGRFIDARAAIAMETRRAETTGSVAKP